MGKASVGERYLTVHTGGSNPAVVALSGGQDIQVPGLFVSGGPGEDGQKGVGKVAAVDGWQVGRTSQEFLHDFMVEEFNGTFVSRSTIHMQVLVAIHPLVPSNVVGLLEEACHPPLGTLGDTMGRQVSGNVGSPGEGGEAFQEVLPSDRVLGMEDLEEVWWPVGRVNAGDIGAPGSETLDHCFSKEWRSLGIIEEEFKVFNAFGPCVIGELGSTAEDMGGVFRCTTTGAAVIVLLLPEFHGDTDGTVLRGEFGAPAAPA